MITSFEKIIKLSPKAFQSKLEELETQAQQRAKADEVDRKASLIVSFLGSILFTIIMTFVIKLASY